MKTMRFTARGIDESEFLISIIVFAPPPPETANVFRRVTTGGTNLKFLWSIDYRGESDVELILTNEKVYSENQKYKKNKLMQLMTSILHKNKIPSTFFLLWLRKI